MTVASIGPLADRRLYSTDQRQEDVPLTISVLDDVRAEKQLRAVHISGKRRGPVRVKVFQGAVQARCVARVHPRRQYYDLCIIISFNQFAI